MNHDDVLDAPLPSDEGKRTELLEIVKQRAKGAFQMRDVRSAEKLYTKCIDLANKDIFGQKFEKDRHILYSNRAAVRLLKQNFEGALNDCERSLDIDAAFIKTHFRKGQSLIGLKRFEEAISACESAFSLHGDNAQLKELLQEAETKWEKHKEELEKQESQQDRDTYRSVKRVEQVAVPKKEEGDAAAEEGSPSAKDGSPAKPKDDGQMRGYKKTADGKTTSYFHTELSAEAKALIGDCKPQKIEAPAEEKKETVGSAWNQAGTFEDRSYTQWMKDNLTKDVSGKVTIAGQPVSFSCSKTSGDAHIAVARGKVKYIHDMHVTIDWRFYIGDKEDNKRCKGKLFYEADGNGGWDVTFEVDSSSHSEGRAFINDHVKKEGLGLQKAALEKLEGVEKMWREVKV